MIKLTLWDSGAALYVAPEQIVEVMEVTAENAHAHGGEPGVGAFVLRPGAAFTRVRDSVESVVERRRLATNPIVETCSCGTSFRLHDPGSDMIVKGEG